MVATALRRWKLSRDVTLWMVEILTKNIPCINSDICIEQKYRLLDQCMDKISYIDGNEIDLCVDVSVSITISEIDDCINLAYPNSAIYFYILQMSQNA